MGVSIARADEAQAPRHVCGGAARSDPCDDWIVVVRDIQQGYIRDDGAKDWGADELLQNPEDGTVCGRIVVEITFPMGEKSDFGDEPDQRSGKRASSLTEWLTCVGGPCARAKR